MNPDADRKATSTYERLVEEGKSASERLVDVRRDGDRALITLGDPDRLNVLSAPLVQQLKSALTELAGERAIRSIVITGAGRAFSAGGDLRMMSQVVASLDARDAEGTADIYRWIRNEFGGIARLIARTDKAFIAAINGPAAGVGLAWAFSCDIVVASDDAVIVPAFGRLGLLPEVGTSWALTRRLGYQGAFAYYVRGEHIDAAEALRLGLVQEVVSAARLLDAADAWCDRVAALPSHALEMSKPLLRAAADASWDGSLAMEEFAEPACFTTQAFGEAVRSMQPSS
jgi:2-(1,2-epoxy-1,2-dihydrophenyl)acetyl-CoA isomerase